MGKERVKVAGKNIVVFSRGNKENPKVVLSGGYFTNPEMYSRFTALLENEGFYVMSPYLNGETPSSIEEGAEVLLEILNHYGDEVTLLGHSTGGAISLDAAAEDSALVKRVIAVNSVRPTNGGLDDMLKGAFESVIYDAGRSETRKRDMALYLSKAYVIGFLRNPLSTAKLLDDILNYKFDGEVDVPVTFVHGVRDEIFNARKTELFCDRNGFGYIPFEGGHNGIIAYSHSCFRPIVRAMNGEHDYQPKEDKERRLVV